MPKKNQTQIMMIANFHTDSPPPSHSKCPFYGELEFDIRGISCVHKDGCQNPIVLNIRKKRKKR